MGHEFAGTVEALGANAGQAGLSIGDKVAVEPGVTCGTCKACRAGFGNLCAHRSIIGIDRQGAFAPRVVTPAQNAFRLPDDADMRMAAFLEVFALGLHTVDRAKLRPQHRVLIVGAGPVGLSAVALAKLAGCREVVAAGAPHDVEVRLPMAEQLGATSTVVSSHLAELEQFDVVIEASGAAAGIRAGIAACKTGGRVVAVGTAKSNVELDWNDIVMRAVTITPVRARLDASWSESAALLNRIDAPDGFFEDFCLDQIDEAFSAALEGTAVKVLVVPSET
jgi:threonine dehydrogenase-like Zn-dependent dehydrogenase